MQKTYSRKKKAEPQQQQPSSSKLAVNDETEKEHFQKVVNSFKFYSKHLLMKINFSKQLVESLPEYQQKLLSSYTENLTEVAKCVEHNQEIINLIIQDLDNMFENTSTPTEENMPEDQRPSVTDLERVQTTLKQLVRDWCEAGASERSTCYQPIIDEVVRNFPPSQCVNNIKILVPGAGLGRLAFEIASKGYSCEGNEFSLFMIFAANFVLNRCNGIEMHRIHPWVHQVDNNMSVSHQIQMARFPDVNPTAMLKLSPSTFTMAAGDFLEIYKESDKWDCVATCFFIDCANNIVEFIAKIYHILKPGGVWINLGPLLYHFSNIPGEFSIEPPYTVVKDIIIGIGFKFEKEETGVKTKYVQNPNSMLQYEYSSVFFVCRKPI